MCVVLNMSVFWSSLTSCFPGMLLTYFLSDFEIVPVAPIVVPSRAVSLGKLTVAVKRTILEFPRDQGINGSDGLIGGFAFT